MAKSGFVALLGPPNVGKSTLLNTFMQEPLAIVSSKPETTRNQILGILSTAEGQAVFVDTPGWRRPSHLLGQTMLRSARNASDGADVALLIIDPFVTLDSCGEILASIAPSLPLYLIINKVDVVAKERLLPLIDLASRAHPFREIFPISALHADGTDELLEAVWAALPDGEPYFDADQRTDRDVQFHIREAIREQALRLTEKEIPHAVGVRIDDFVDSETPDGPLQVRATMLIEKASQKPILIGHQGRMIRNIRLRAQRALKRQLGRSVQLDLWVKVSPDWRRNPRVLKELYYS